jgi:hypothetical protein
MIVERLFRNIVVLGIEKDTEFVKQLKAYGQLADSNKPGDTEILIPAGTMTLTHC